MTAPLAIVRGVPRSYAHATVRSPLGPIDVELARAQHAAYVAALRSLGAVITSVPADDDLPDSCFVEDHAVVIGDLALACRLGHVGRRAEAGPVRAALAEHLALSVMTDGTLDGGDVLRVGRTLFVGRSARTDADGIAALDRTFAPHGYRVIPVPIEHHLHLKCVATALDDTTVLLADGTVDPSVFRGFDVVRVDAADAYAANVVASGRGALVAAGFPRVEDALTRRGFHVVPVELSEFRKGDGSCTCLSILLYRAP